MARQKRKDRFTRTMDDISLLPIEDLPFEIRMIYFYDFDIQQEQALIEAILDRVIATFKHSLPVSESFLRDHLIGWLLNYSQARDGLLIDYLRTIIRSFGVDPDRGEYLSDLDYNARCYRGNGECAFHERNNTSNPELLSVEIVSRDNRLRNRGECHADDGSDPEDWDGTDDGSDPECLDSYEADEDPEQITP